MAHPFPRAARIGAGVALVALAFGACSLGGSGAGVPPTATPNPCATHATTTAIAWAEAGDKQIHGSLGGGAPGVLSNFTYPLGVPDETFEAATVLPGFLTFSPDGHHIAVDMRVYVPFARDNNIYIVDTATHAVTHVTALALGPDPQGQEARQLAWADNHTVIAMPGPRGPGGSAAAYSYDITTNTATALPGVTNAIEGVVRCGTLFYSDLSAGSTLSDPNHTTVFHERIHRYDLASHAEVGSPLTISDAFTYGGAEGEISYAGWDVSRDGTRIVWQQGVVSSSTMDITSTFHSANADGSGAGLILTGPPAATAHAYARMAISADGTKVAVTGAAPTPSVITGPVTGGGGIRYYTPDQIEQPAWLPDNSGFLAGGDGFTPGIEQYLLATPLNAAGQAPGTTAHANGYYPATLP
ncbi:MAG TPA: hypothetical protein VF807_09225 [Ktedonobacterales bacterium]